MPLPNPGRPPPNVPIPGEPTLGDEKNARKYTCPKCGKVFTMEEELNDHMKIVHGSSQKTE